jgi:hypothetical protein
VQPFLVVDFGNEPIDLATSIADVGKCLAVDLFGLERLHEAFSLGVVKRVSRPAHADGDVAIGKPLAISDGGVLHAAIRMMDQTATRRPPRGDRLIQCGNGERSIERVIERPADGPARERVEDDGKIGEGLGEMDIGDGGRCYG